MSMITCPRCGFEQPDDRFCAKCGILMEGYVGKKPPLWTRLKSSMPFYGLVLALTLIVIYLLFSYSKKEENPDAKTETQTAEAPSAPSPVTQAAPPASARASGFRPAMAQTTVAQEVGNTEAPPPPAVADAGAGSARTASADPTSVRIEFASLNREALERLVQEADGRLEIGRYSMASIAHFHTHYEQAAKSGGFQSLSAESRSLTLGQPSLVFRGGKEPKSNDTIGFFVEVTALKRSDRGFDYKISIKRSLPEVSPTGEIKVVSQNFDESVTLPASGAVAIAGLLPRKILVQGEDELYANNILKPLIDPAFQKGDAEFVVLIHPSHSGEDSE